MTESKQSSITRLHLLNAGVVSIFEWNLRGPASQSLLLAVVFTAKEVFRDQESAK